MTSLLSMADAPWASNDPFSASLLPPSEISTFFDSFATSQYPWATQNTFNTSCQSSPILQNFPPVPADDGFCYPLTSPLQSPDFPFFLDIEPDKTTYETCYDEFMEFKLAVIREILNRGSRLMSAMSTPDSDISDSPGSSPPSSPPSSVSSTPSTSYSNSSSACHTPERGRTTDVAVADNDSDTEDAKDGDYLPFEFHHSSPPICRRLFGTKPESQKHSEPKKKRKATYTFEQPLNKRQKYDTDVICRILGCRHVSKTRYECFKHRETHFPGRFQCPQPDCRKIFVRSSSLSRHLKRERDRACGIFAGPQAKWGVGLINFELFPPPWLAPGYLDDISDT